MYIYIYLLIYTYTYTCFCKYIKFMNLGNLKLMNMLLSYLIKCSWAHPKHPSPPWSIKGDFCPIRPKICLWNLLKSAIFYGAGIIFCNTSMFLVLVFFLPKHQATATTAIHKFPVKAPLVPPIVKVVGELWAVALVWMIGSLHSRPWRKGKVGVTVSD